jgi:hypothetical protein
MKTIPLGLVGLLYTGPTPTCETNTGCILTGHIDMSTLELCA